ncbi:uncharacterized protein LOC112194807 isoform X4 [Rosa chinensis]|nr:uncharacterized protein LOC112194807 isoform X4 [Rosa chinensis]XP_024190811.1 uncharacterized protein LOC112194807 isoform X4 [Rosa chinensis]
MDQMERVRARHRQWRESMSSSQRQAYLARRRAIAQEKRPVVETSPSNRAEQAPEEFDNEGTRSRISSNSNNPEQDYTRVRLTRIRQMARSNRSETSDGVVRISTRYELPNATMNNHEEHNSNNVAMNNDEEHTNNIEEDNESEPMNNHEERRNNIHQVRRMRRARINNNSARDFHEEMGVHDCQLPPLKTCPYCNALLFNRETFSLCCLKGNIVLPLIQSPPEMVHLFSDQTDEGRKFRQNIRAYNNVFAFTSMGVHVDERINIQGRGPYTFRAQGSIYHKIGGLLPIDGRRPRYLQAYIYDTEHELENRLTESEVLERGMVEKIQQILNQHNPFVQTFRSLGQRQDLPNCRLIIREQPSDRRQYNLPSASQVAAIIVGGDDINPNGRDFIVETISGQLWNVKDSVGYYDPMQYPLLLPYGTYGWDINTHGNNGRPMSCCDYYAYMLQMRQGHENPLHRGGRLFQQYVVDNYVKIESQKLRWLRSNQEKFRREFRQGLQDSLHAGENDAGNVGRRTILPSSFIGSPRDMYQRYQDAMALVQKYGRPDLFITMTCNPNWEEVRNELLPGQTPQDRPDLVTRVFHAKFEQLKEDIINKGVLGKVAAHAFVVEFQKRGLPHVHMLIMLEENDKLNNPDEYDRIVRAEIPYEDEEPQLYDAVCTHMIHGPCGTLNPRQSCMKNGSCNKSYPKPFANFTVQGNDAYPVYRRRASRLPVPLRRRGDVMVDNGWVVPYNPWLLLRYNCHINVEICGSIKSVKYLYKYIYKGPDRVELELQSNPEFDEIRQFVDARWVCAPEALWRIFKFAMNRIYPTVERLQIHLPNMQQITFSVDETVENILADEHAQMSMLTEFFTINRMDEDARTYLYREIPEHYRWDNSNKIWVKRRRNYKVIGRIYSVSPSEGEKFYLRVLLNHVRGPRSFRDLLTVNGVLQPTFKQAAEKQGLLENDNSIRQCLLEASAIRMPSTLRRLFVTILVYNEPIGVRTLWDEFFPFMVEDYPSSGDIANQNRLLQDLNGVLEQFNRNIRDFDLPEMTTEPEENSRMPRCIEDELSVHISQEDIDAIDRLNDDQRIAFDTIMDAVQRKRSALFFVDGPGGTGKTYLYRALLANIRRMNHIVLATASSGIAANILPGGRTAHSRFKIPLNVDASSMCSISKQSALAQLVQDSTAIIWDEAPMTHRHVFEALDRTFRDIMDVDLPFGGKIMIFGGDFRQVLPVIPKGTKSELIQASIVKSTFWTHIKILRLRQNMRSINDHQFAEFLLRVGDGSEQVINDEMIRLPECMVVPWESDQSINLIIDEVFPNLGDHVNDARYMVDRALITPINDDVDVLNEKIIYMFPGEEITLYSFDSVEDDSRNLYQPEFLNSITAGGLPPHKLTLKVGAPIMLLRNIDPKLGLCNGTRLLCRGSYQNLIDAEILTGQFAGTRVFLPRIPLKSAENAGLPFQLTRKQFPVKLSFCLTINKSQGQTIPHVGVYLPDHVFSHGQLYVALSRGVSESTTKVLVKKGSIVGEDGVFTKNVVFKEVLLHSNTNDRSSS